MNLKLKGDPVWFGSLPSPDASPTLLLLGGDGQQVAVPAPLLLAVSPLVRSILTDLLPPAYSPCFFSLPGATEDVLHVVVDILATGAAGGEHKDKIQNVRQVFEMLGVEVSLVNCQVDSGQADWLLDRSVKTENSSERSDVSLEEKNIIEVILKTEAVEKQVKFSCDLCPQKFTQKISLVRHIKSVHDKVKFSCNLCLKKFPQEKNLGLHIKSVHEEISGQNIFKIGTYFQANCECNFQAKVCQTAVKHLMSKHNLKAILPDEECQNCGKTCQRVFINKHVCTDPTKTRQGNPAKYYTCSICTVVYTNYRGLAQHKITLHGMSEEEANPAGLCSRCGKENKSVFQKRHRCTN